MPLLISFSYLSLRFKAIASFRSDSLSEFPDSLSYVIDGSYAAPTIRLKFPII